MSQAIRAAFDESSAAVGSSQTSSRGDFATAAAKEMREI
jgi:hypothetical protein